MQWPQRCVLTGILYSLLILPFLEIIKDRTSEMTILIDESSFSFDPNDNKSQKAYQFQESTDFNMNPLPSAFATDPDSICPEISKVCAIAKGEDLSQDSLLESYGTATVQNILCVECRSDKQPYCRDPFNRTLLNFNDIPFKLCNGYCVKWIRGPLNEDLQQDDLYIRTCSSNLNIRFQISPVCLHESHSINRRLCFCDRSKCNSLSRIHISPFILLVLLLSHFHQHFFHFLP